MAQKPSIPKGTRDFGPDEMIKRTYIFDTIKSVFRTYGFLPLETPAMENLSTLLGKYGDEGDKLLFKILNSARLLVNVDFADGKAVRVLLSNLLIRRADLPAIAAPWRPEIHQNRLFLPDQLLKLLLIHIHSCHICQLLSFVWVFSRLRSRPTPHCDLILR